jgi:processive 1,2-diacylglycerol beta-glucosyltransferase
MKRFKVHVLYEHGRDQQPFGTAQIRLLRPLTHPAVQGCLDMTAGLDYDGQAVDAVIVDRLWRPDVTCMLVERLADGVRRAGARLIYSIDDNLLDLVAESKDWHLTDEQLRVLDFLLRQADGILVATPSLQERLKDYNPNIVVVPNGLDERLIGSGRGKQGVTSTVDSVLAGSAQMKVLFRRALDIALSRSSTPARRIVVGYMGTHTHDDDLLMILPALLEIWRRHRDEVKFQMVGVLAHRETLKRLEGLPVRFVIPPARGRDYLRFMPWFTSQLRWDIAIAPLEDTAFSRCKSDIKYLDYSALGVVGIYSRVPAYASTVRHLDTGWLAENTPTAWGTALQCLLDDEALRNRLAHRAACHLRDERTLEKCAWRWPDALERLLG